MQVRIEKLVYGGAGMARTDRGVVFVEQVLPGELIEVEEFERKKDYSRARLMRVLEPSDSRRAPACPNFESVGCCDWAHIPHTQQKEIKEAILVESLRRLGQLDWTGPVKTIAGPETGYRLRAVFHVSEGLPGFVRERTHEIIPIEGCTALVPELNSFLKDARSALREGRWRGSDTIRAIASPSTGEVAATFSHGRRTVAWTHRVVRTEIRGIGYRLRPAAFFQPNRYMLDPLMSRVVEHVGSGPQTLDLFCGDAFFSLPLAATCDQIVGVDRRSTTGAERNARNNGIRNVRFVKSSALAFLKNAGIRPHAVVLDPPRSGAGRNLTRRVARLGAARIVYVSCNPATLAADSRVLIEDGYRLTHLELLDQFPNTHHIEAIATFEIG